METVCQQGQLGRSKYLSRAIRICWNVITTEILRRISYRVVRQRGLRTALHAHRGAFRLELRIRNERRYATWETCVDKFQGRPLHMLHQDSAPVYNTEGNDEGSVSSSRLFPSKKTANGSQILVPCGRSAPSRSVLSAHARGPAPALSQSRRKAMAGGGARHRRDRLFGGSNPHLYVGVFRPPVK